MKHPWAGGVGVITVMSSLIFMGCKLLRWLKTKPGSPRQDSSPELEFEEIEWNETSNDPPPFIKLPNIDATDTRRLIAHLKRAKHLVCICVHSLNNPVLKTTLLNLAERGVKVKICILSDLFGGWKRFRSPFPRFQFFTLEKWRNKLTSNPRLFENFVLIDNHTVMRAPTNWPWDSPTTGSDSSHITVISVSHDKDEILEVWNNFDYLWQFLGPPSNSF